MKRLTMLALILVTAAAAMGQTVATMTSPWYYSGGNLVPREGDVLIYDPTATTGASSLTVRAGASQSTTATLGSELLTNGTFTGSLTGWTVSGTGLGWTYSSDKALHGTGNTETLSQNIAVTNGTTYQIEFTISGRTAGDVTITLGAATLINSGSDSSFASNETYKRTLVGSGTSTQAFTFTPTSTFDGSVDSVTCKAITGTIPSLLTLKDSSGNVVSETRGDSSLSNSAVGYQALYSNTTGNYNSAQGLSALYSNTTGGSNSAQGANALYSNTTGSSNSAQGVSALRSNTTGGSNSAQGANALRSNTTGSSNSAQGVSALYSNTTGNYNSAQGANALRSNTTGVNNSAQGGYALYSNTTGSSNSAQGLSALYSNTTGSSNSAQGVNALRSNTTGSYNSAQGEGAGRYIADGASANATPTNGLYLGYGTRASADAMDNEIVIGASAIGNGSNSVTLGNASVTKTVLRGSVGIGTIDFDGTPAVGKLIIKGTTNDGSTFPVMIRDSDEANVAWVNSNGVGVFTGSPTTDVASDSPVAAYLGAAGTLGYSSCTEAVKAAIVDAPESDIIDQLRVREFERRPRVQIPYEVEIEEKSTDDVEVSLEDAMEVVEVDVPVTFPIQDPNGPEVDMSQYVDTKTTYQLHGDKIVTVETQTPKTTKVQQKRLKDGYRIDETTGKVIHSVSKTTTRTETRYRDEYTKEAVGDGIKRIGLIAEEVNQIAPLYVYKDATGKPLGVHYDQFISLLIQKVQDQQKQIDALDARVKKLEAK